MSDELPNRHAWFKRLFVQAILLALLLAVAWYVFGFFGMSTTLVSVIVWYASVFSIAIVSLYEADKHWKTRFPKLRNFIRSAVRFLERRRVSYVLYLLAAVTLILTLWADHSENTLLTLAAGGIGGGTSVGGLIIILQAIVGHESDKQTKRQLEHLRTVFIADREGSTLEQNKLSLGRVETEVVGGVKRDALTTSSRGQDVSELIERQIANSREFVGIQSAVNADFARLSPDKRNDLDEVLRRIELMLKENERRTKRWDIALGSVFFVSGVTITLVVRFLL